MSRYTYNKLVQDCLECLNVLNNINERDLMLRDLMLRVYPNNLEIGIDDKNIDDEDIDDGCNQLLFIELKEDNEEHEYEDIFFDEIHILSNTRYLNGKTVINFINAMLDIHGNYDLRNVDIYVNGKRFEEYKKYINGEDDD